MWHVGVYLLNWGRLEKEISSSIAQMDPTSVGPHVHPDRVSRTLEHLLGKWVTVYCDTTATEVRSAKQLRDDIMAAAKDRNSICHGFSGIGDDGGDYMVVCWEMYHRQRMTGEIPRIQFYPKVAMSKMCGDLGAFAREVERLTAIAISRPRTRRKRPES